MNKDEILLSYLAGIIDGEGTISIMKHKPRSHPDWSGTYDAYVRVGMTDKNIPKLFLDTFGVGALNLESRAGSMARDVWRYTCSGNKGVVPIVEALYPYLKLKKEQCKLVLELLKGRDMTFKRVDRMPQKEIEFREDIFIKIRKLNERGRK